jgi:hypothetical protein
MSDFEYRAEVGRAEIYSFSYGSLRFFFLGASAEGSCGPISSSDEEPSSF